jgi:hypothetical protein
MVEPRPVAPKGARAQAAAPQPFVPIDKSFIEQPALTATSAFAIEADRRFVAPPWHLRSSLLHGAIYGVPVRGNPLIDRRPASATLAVALGQHDDDLVAAFASPPQATLDQRRATERLLAAFTAQKVNRLASPDGVVELEEHEHASAFSSLPAGSAGTDRYLQRVQTGGAGGLKVGRNRAEVVSPVMQRAVTRDPSAASFARPMAAGAPVSAAQGVAGAQTFFASSGRPTLVVATEMVVNDIARSRVGDVLAPTEARVVDRPAHRFTFPDEPIVAVRGASRSLRHGGDGEDRPIAS